MISIIIPVYNTEKYLCDCINSILLQSNKDFELLLIDDGSTDNSGKICDDYADKDKRIRVFHKKNEGVSTARNVGLDNAKGEWICFIDSDDTIFENTIENYNQHISDNTDLIMYSFRINYASGKTYDYSKYNNREFSQESFLKEMYTAEGADYQGYIWNKLFRREIIQQYQLRFNGKINFNEDRLFVVQFVCKSSKSIFFVNKMTYIYYERQDSKMDSIKHRYNKQFVDDFDALLLMKKEIDKLLCGKKLRRFTLNGIYNSYNWNHNLMIQFKDYSSQNHWHMLWELIKNKLFISFLKYSVKDSYKETIKSFIKAIYPNLFIIKKNIFNKNIK